MHTDYGKTLDSLLSNDNKSVLNGFADESNMSVRDALNCILDEWSTGDKEQRLEAIGNAVIESEVIGQLNEVKCRLDFMSEQLESITGISSF
ncbi:MAG: hypothetical protein AAFQ80_05425 [Cyanobacteria bacterium J06621_8]